jgi:hypothetical protein
MSAMVPSNEIGSDSAGMMVADGQPQEKVDHQHHEECGDAERELHVVDGRADRDGAVVAHLDAHRLRQLRDEARERRLDRVDRGHGVGVGLALDGQRDRALVVHPARGLDVLDAVLDVGHVLEAHRVAVGQRRDDELGELRRARELLVGLDGERLALALERSHGRVGVGGLERRGHIVHREVARGESVGAHANAHREALLPVHVDLRDAGQRRKRGGDEVVAEGIQVRQRHRRRRDRHEHDRRVGRVHLAVERRRGHLHRQVARGAEEGGLHVHRGLVDVAVLGEFEGDLRLAERGRRADHVQVGDGGELLLERRGDRGGHVLRARPRQKRVTWMVGVSNWGSAAIGMPS